MKTTCSASSNNRKTAFGSIFNLQKRFSQ